jgi:hypothetical protein
MSNERGSMDRREFLIVSSTVAVATAAAGPKLFAAQAAAPKQLAIGFAPPGEAGGLVAASSITSGDGAFNSRGARVIVSGASGIAADPRSRRAVDLVVNYSYFEGAQRREAPFRAWSCNRATGCQGSPVSFTVPVDETQKISFRVGVEDAAPVRQRAATESGPRVSSDDGLPLTLSMLSDPSSLKLVRGYYVIVPLFEGDREPRWSAWTLDRREGRWALHDADGKVAPFEHFVLEIDYAA